MTGATPRTAGIAGAGILGRLIGYYLAGRGWRVTLFDAGDIQGRQTASWVAAGMVAPYCELETAEPVVAKLGAQSMDAWRQVLKTVDGVFLQSNGSLVVAHPQDRAELTRLARAVAGNAPEGAMKKILGPELKEMEPDLDDTFADGLYFPLEGQIDSRQILAALARHLEAAGHTLMFRTMVTSIGPNAITTDKGAFTFDMAVDTRGLTAKDDLPGLRGVRGEMVRLHAPDVRLNRPVRLMHPRYPLYIVPRPRGHYIVGATSIEKEDCGPVSVRGVLELLSAAYSLCSGFSEARITETLTQSRPAFVDNLPRIFHGRGLVRANGLYRHGYLLSPKIASLVVSLIEGEKPEGEFAGLYGDIG